MSSRTRSDFGALGDRARGRRRELPCHVWVDGGPAVLLEWQRRADGWWGRCLLAQEGVGAEMWVRADRITPA